LDRLFTFFYQSPIGEIRIDWNDKGIFHSEICSGVADIRLLSLEEDIDIKKDFDAYFADGKYQFQTKVNPIGTMFQLQVWQALLQLRVGDVVTYGSLAKMLSTSAQAIGNACRTNPLAIMVPCHRVVSLNGIGGYYGESSGVRIDAKRWLLQHEGIDV